MSVYTLHVEIADIVRKSFDMSDVELSQLVSDMLARAADKRADRQAKRRVNAEPIGHPQSRGTREGN